MEPQVDMVKLKHSQHVRLLQEQDEEMWISSEDLRTDGESDEECLRKSNLSKKCTKQMKNEALLKKVVSAKLSAAVQNPNQDAYKVDDSELLRLKLKCEKEINQRQSSASGDGAAQYDSNLGSSTQNEAAGTSESDVEALNLESKWRPKRGSLKLPNLVEGDVTNMDSNGLSLFYNEMLLNLHTLQRTPILNDEDEIEDYTFDEFPDLGEEKEDDESVKQAKNYIKKMDEDIAEAIGLYKAERNERMEAQKEMCKSIYGSGEPLDRQSQIFLSLCEDQNKASTENMQNKDVEIKTTENARNKSDSDNRFIKRNIELAKNGSMAKLSLTDEEKERLESILTETDQDMTDRISSSTLESIESEDEELNNAFKMSQTEISRLDEINKKLKDLCHDHEEFEKNVDISVYKNMSAFSLQKALQEINRKLNEINEEIDQNDFNE